MKKFLLLVLAMSFLAVSCKKDNDEVEATPYDNITVSQTQEAFVLLTTATWCGYCGQWGIPTFEEAFAGDGNIDATRVNGLALHYSSSDPMYLAMSNTLKSQYGIGGPPNLWIEFNNAYNLQPSGWKNAIVQRQAETSVTCGVGLYAEKVGDSFSVHVKVQFFSSLTGTYNLAVYAIENNIVASQVDYGSGTTISNYNHMRVLRGEIVANNYFGGQMFSGTSPSEFTKSYSYTPDAGINSSNVHFVAVIYEMSGGVPVSAPNSNTY
ncbi:MAG: hypothetical protein C0592_03905 [Marinilabiliales bacterium]|nr:MAG: hypothetical protein C0592_03905 [Marinilabiliales bacterium]